MHERISAAPREPVPQTSQRLSPDIARELRQMDRRLNHLLELLSQRPNSADPPVLHVEPSPARRSGEADLEEKLLLIGRFHQEWRLLEEDGGRHPDRQLADFGASGYLDQFARHLGAPFALLDSQGLLLRGEGWPDGTEGAPLPGRLEASSRPGRMRLHAEDDRPGVEFRALRLGSGLLLVDDRAL